MYEAERTEVILGRSCSDEGDVHVSNCKQDNVPIRKRLGGGGTALLSKDIIIISVTGVTSIPFQLREHMNAVNNTWCGQAIFKIKKIFSCKLKFVPIGQENQY